MLRHEIGMLTKTCRTSLLIVDEIGYLPVIPGGGNLFFQLVNARGPGLRMRPAATMRRGERNSAVSNATRNC